MKLFFKRNKFDEWAKFRFATLDDVTWFEKTVKRVAVEDLGERLAEHVTANRVFVDFMR